MATVDKVVIPVAGLGTRFLPATKATPKEMLPVVDKPAIQYVVEEAVAAGLTDVLMVTGRSKRSLEDHFDNSPDLRRALEAKNDLARLALVEEPTHMAQFHYVRQGEALGLGHAVLCGRGHVGDNAFAVMLGDDLIDDDHHVLPTMLDVQQRFGGSVLCLMEVPSDQVHLYGCAAVEATGDEGIVRVAGLVEKPAPGTEPSNYAVIGRYVLDPAVFGVLERTEPGRGGEIQLTDALQELAVHPHRPGHGVLGVVFKGKRYDTGDKLSYLKAVVQLAAVREDLGGEFTEWLRSFVVELDAADGPQ